MSANNFVRPSWVKHLLIEAHGRALPQYTDAAYHSANLAMGKKKLVDLLRRSQTEYNRLSGVAERLEQENKTLRDGTYSTRIQEDFDREEQNGFAESEDYDEKVYTDQTAEEALGSLPSQHNVIEGARERVKNAEKENKELRKEFEAKNETAGGIDERRGVMRKGRSRGE